jgi:hypothetical protein
LHEIERLVSEKSMRELMINFVNGHQPSELPDSNFIESLGPDFLSNPNLIRLILYLKEQFVTFVSLFDLLDT